LLPLLAMDYGRISPHNGNKNIRGNAGFMMKKIAIVLVLGVIAVALIKRDMIYRLYFGLNLENPEHIADNLHKMDTILRTSTVAKSSQPQPFKHNLQTSVLPKSFINLGEQIDTQQFLNEVKTTGLLVLKDGEIIHEEYRNGLAANKRQHAFSVNKSITSVLIGFALQDGLINSIEDPIVQYLPDFADSGWSDSIIRYALETSSGVDFDEDYTRTDTDLRKFQIQLMLDRPVRPFITQFGSKREPGTYHGYNSMETMVLGFILSEVLGEQSLSDYMHEKLWQPLGAEDEARWTTDITGQEITVGGLSLSLRDLAKIGQLFLQRGVWNDQQLLAEDWVVASTTAYQTYQQPGRNNPASAKPFGYAYQWWIPVDPNGREYYASGLYGH